MFIARCPRCGYSIKNCKCKKEICPLCGKRPADPLCGGLCIECYNKDYEEHQARKFVRKANYQRFLMEKKEIMKEKLVYSQYLKRIYREISNSQGLEAAEEWRKKRGLDFCKCGGLKKQQYSVCYDCYQKSRSQRSKIGLSENGNYINTTKKEGEYGKNRNNRKKQTKFQR